MKETTDDESLVPTQSPYPKKISGRGRQIPQMPASRKSGEMPSVPLATGAPYIPNTGRGPSIATGGRRDRSSRKGAETAPKLAGMYLGYLELLKNFYSLGSTAKLL